MRRLAPLLASLAVMAFPAAARSEAVVFGFNDGTVLDDASDDFEADLLANVGAQVHRVTLPWRGVEPQRGRYDFSRFDSIYNADIARGVHPLFILSYAPQWAWKRGLTCATPTGCAYPPARRYFPAWRALVRRVIARYPQLEGIEVWNEPNQDFFWTPKPNPRAYTALLRQAWKAARKAKTTIPILAGSLSDGPVKGGIHGMDPARFLRKMYKHRARGRFDLLSLHPYPKGRDLAPMYQTLTEIEAVQARYRDRKPIWVTEIGASSPAEMNQNDQAALLVWLLKAFESRPNVPVVLIHTLLAPGTTNPFQNGFAIVSKQGQPAPAYCALATLRLRSPSNCHAPLFGTYRDPEQEARWDAQGSVAAQVDAAASYARRHKGSLAGFQTPGRQPDPAASAGSGADPADVGTYRIGEGDATATLLCAASRADTSYCALHQVGQRWRYGFAEGSIGAAANRTLRFKHIGWG